MITRQELLEQIKVAVASNSDVLSSLSKLVDFLIEDCHVANENNKGDEFLSTQGEIRAYRKIKLHIK